KPACGCGALIGSGCARRQLRAASCACAAQSGRRMRSVTRAFRCRAFPGPARAAGLKLHFAFAARCPRAAAAAAQTHNAKILKTAVLYPGEEHREIGRASCRERVETPVVVRSLNAMA